MDRLHGWVRSLMEALWNALSFVLLIAFRILRPLFGDLDWQPPSWVSWAWNRLKPLGRWSQAKAGWVALLMLLAGLTTYAALNGPPGGWKTWWEWQTFEGTKTTEAALPPPPRVVVSIQNPRNTPYEGDAKPRPAIVSFSASVAPLARVGKEATDFSISPPIAGKWTWVSASRAAFLPDDDWPIGEHYIVTIGEKALASKVELSPQKLALTAPAFTISLLKASFYQDPVQVTLRKAVFDLSFSHPVDVATLENRLNMEWLKDPKGDKKVAVKWSISYDKQRLAASVHSEALPIPPSEESMILNIAAGVTAQRGGGATPQEALYSVVIPGVNSLSIDELRQMIVTSESGEPEHVLQIRTGMGVHEKEMSRAVSAWLLPLKKPGDDASSTDWSNQESIPEEILKKSKRLPLNLVPAEREASETHTFKFDAEPARYVLVRFQKDLKSIGGYQLGMARDEIIRVRRSAPELTLMSKGSLMALSGDKKLPVVVRDLPGMRVEIGRLLPQQLQHMVTQSQGVMSKPEFYMGITPDHLTERFEKKIPLKLKPGKSHYETIDFSEYLRADASDRRGIFLLTVQGYDPQDKTAPAIDPSQYARRNGGGEEGEEGDAYGEEDQAGDEDATEKINPAQMRDRRLVIVTDLGVVAKQGLDGSRDVFVQSIANGQPVGNASVEIWAQNGSILTSQTTASDGHVHLPSLSGMTREKAPVVLVVRKEGDMSFLPLNRADRNLDMSRFDIGGLRSANLPNQIQAFLFSDRGIYRPGDTMNIGIVAKSSNWAQKLADLPVEIEVIDARGLVIRRDKQRLGAHGMAEFSHTTQDVSPTGNYTINLNLARDSGSAAPGTAELPPLRLGSLTVKVQEFLPDRMKVMARLSSESGEGWVSPKELKARINVQNLFGTPAQQRRVEATLSLSPAYPAFRSHPGYAFFDPERAKQGFRDELARSQTDATGNVEYDLGLQRYAQATYQLHVLARAFEPEGGRSVSAEVSTLVSDRPFLIGYKSDGDLSYVSRGADRKVSFIAIDPKAKNKTVSDLKLVRLERKVLSVLVKQADGRYKYESRARESVLKEEPFTIAASGANLMLSTQTPGNFAYAVRDTSGLELSRVEYSVAGTGNVSRSLDRNAELQLSLNKKDYAPGEEIEISIRAPYVGAGLITIERDKVFAHKWFVSKDTASVQKITLPPEFEGNGYISVQFARDLGSNEIYMSPLSYGVTPFATSLAKRTLPAKLNAPALLKPGQTAKFTLESPQAGKAVVFAIDEGILQVARYQTPEPLKFFFQKRALEVGTQQTLDLILPEFKKLMQAAPGGDAEGAVGKHLNPFKRRTDKPVVYWSGIVDVKGSREFSYTIPESFNGALRVMAITVNDDAVASLTATTTVRGDLILLPNVPVAITPGDEVEVSIGVANNARGSGKDAAVALNLAVSPALEIIGPPTQTLKISERSEGATRFRVKAKEGAQAQLGSASVIFSAQIADAKGGVKGSAKAEVKARLSTDVSVRPASAYVTRVQTGMFRGDAELKSQADTYPNFKRSEAALSTSPWAFSAGLIQYLDVYPHGCTEQITSQTFPAIVLSSQPGVAEQLQKMSKKQGGVSPDPAQSFARYLTQVRARQGSDGGFSMWPGGPSDLFASTYVVNLLLEAKSRKFTVPNDMLQRANTYLQNRLENINTYDFEWRVQAQAAYLLTRQGIVTTVALNRLRDRLTQRAAGAGNDPARAVILSDLGALYLASSYQLIKQEKVAQELMQPALEQLIKTGEPLQNWSWQYYYDPLVQYAGSVQLIALHFPKQIQALPIDFWTRMAHAISDQRYQSLSAARLLLAIDAYAAHAAKSAAGKLNVGAVDATGQVKALELPQQLSLAKLAVPLETRQLRMRNEGKLPLFYSWAESGFERTPPQEAVSSGLNVVREFLDAKGNVVSSATIGEELTVRIRVRATDRQQIDQVALVDILPGGMDPVLTGPGDNDAPNVPVWQRRLNGKGGWKLDYADIREDRVIFYGNVSQQMAEVSYKVRTTNVGEFVVPAAYGEAMYEPRIFARSAAGRFQIKALEQQAAP